MFRNVILFWDQSSILKPKLSNGYRSPFPIALTNDSFKVQISKKNDNFDREEYAENSQFLLE